jgi:hypothetical protein
MQKRSSLTGRAELHVNLGIGIFFSGVIEKNGEFELALRCCHCYHSSD